MITIKNKKGYLLASILLITAAMNAVETFVQPSYAVKSAVKVLLFLLVPAMFFLSCKEERAAAKPLFIPKKKVLLLSLLLGVVCCGGILGAFFLLKDRFDFSGVTKSLVSSSGVTAQNFPYVALYICLVNSFLEEFFFRGYAFLTLRRHAGRVFSCAFSAFFFSLYHVGMTLGWVPLPLFLLELAGLFVGGIVFDHLCERTGSIYPSFMVHMFCNVGINIIGLILFGIV